MPRSPHNSRRRAWLWGELAALTCPCHQPIMLLALFVLFLARTLRAFRLLH